MPTPALSLVLSRGAFLVPALAALTLLSTFPGKAKGSVLFHEDFEGATSGQLWDGYQGWAGEGSGLSADIVTAQGSKAGHFTNNPTTTGSVTYTFDTPFSLEESAYRLSFDVAGSLLRGFNVALIDSGNLQVGLRLGNSSSSSTHFYAGGYSRTAAGSPVYHWAYESAPGTAPEGYSATTLYSSHIDVNLTGQTVSFFGSPLETGKIRITYNAGQVGGMDSYSVTFDAPAGFSQISAIRAQRAIQTSVQYYVDNLTLQSIPEPGSLSLWAGGIMAAGWFWRTRRNKSPFPRS